MTDVRRGKLGLHGTAPLGDHKVGAISTPSRRCRPIAGERGSARLGQFAKLVCLGEEIAVAEVNSG